VQIIFSPPGFDPRTIQPVASSYTDYTIPVPIIIIIIIIQEFKRRKNNLIMAWIDYQKAFDRMPHSWIIKSLELIGINDKVISFTKKVMPHWRTRMCLHVEQKLIQTEDIKIECGIFQGDTTTTAILHLFDPSH
jgi:hypothetical protein